jgi:hypothetical protein
MFHRESGDFGRYRVLDLKFQMCGFREKRAKEPIVCAVDFDTTSANTHGQIATLFRESHGVMTSLLRASNKGRRSDSHDSSLISACSSSGVSRV